MQTVILHGGGTTAPETTKRLIALAGGPDARIVVLAHTGEDVEGKAKRSANWLRENGAKNVLAPVTVREAVEALDSAAGVWIPGGDQNAFLKAFAGQDLKAKLKSAKVVGGTSAGATLMGSMMPTGGGNATKMTEGSVEIAPGLGALFAVVDTHFFVRQRCQRLINIILSDPARTQIGIGVDENAWCEVSESSLVVRAGQVMLVQALRVPLAKSLAGNLRIKILGLGQSQNLQQPFIV